MVNRLCFSHREAIGSVLEGNEVRLCFEGVTGAASWRLAYPLFTPIIGLFPAYGFTSCPVTWQGSVCRAWKLLGSRQ